MHYTNIGAIKRQTPSPRHGAASNHRMAGRYGATAVLSQPELRRLVAAMVD